MTEQRTELSRQLVVGHKRDGRKRYDELAKRELVEASLRPGVSVARMALEHGINANLLHTWIRRCQGQRDIVVRTPAPGLVLNSAFVPVVTAKPAAKASVSGLGAELPNGVRLDLGRLDAQELPRMLRLLCELPCSGSTPD